MRISINAVDRFKQFNGREFKLDVHFEVSFNQLPNSYMCNVCLVLSTELIT